MNKKDIEAGFELILLAKGQKALDPKTKDEGES